MAYQPIEDYGIIGNMHTAALVGRNGSIDWFCYPHFDSAAVFGAILDDRIGGRFRIHSVPEDKGTQFYWPETNVLVTRFANPDGVGELRDYMPIAKSGEPGHRWLVRRVLVARGSMKFRLECSPAFDYARAEHQTEISSAGVAFRGPGLSLGLTSSVPLRQHESGVAAEFTLREGQTAVFVLREMAADEKLTVCTEPGEAFDLFVETVDYWRRWLSKCTYKGRWRETVHRSALALKLLTFEPTGAIVAAPTCSLPEGIGGVRNWDYRYTWLRDAAFTVYAFMRIGFTDEAAQFMRWLGQRSQEPNPDGSLQIMYGIDGRHELKEETLDHLEGYRGSKPVRIGNGAHGQLQLDIYGELLDSIYLYNKYGNQIGYDGWTVVRKLIDWVCDHWQKKDEGIWEVRSGRNHFVYSKLMCWVALDRGLRLARKRSFPADHVRWLSVRDKIYEEIMTRGWNADRGAFVQAYDSDALDAANLMMPLTFFVAPRDPRMLKTLDAIRKTPEQGGLLSNSLVYRYNIEQSPDGLHGDEGTFSICTFWLVEALTRAGREDRALLDEARLMFEQMLSYSNRLELYAEQIGHSGEALGNYPQAFTHLALISAAFNLDRELGSGA